MERGQKDAQPVAWWLQGDQQCDYCLQSYALEAAFRCDHCDEAICPECVVEIRESASILCSRCAQRDAENPKK